MDRVGCLRSARPPPPKWGHPPLCSSSPSLAVERSRRWSERVAEVAAARRLVRRRLSLWASPPRRHPAGAVPSAPLHRRPSPSAARLRQGCCAAAAAGRPHPPPPPLPRSADGAFDAAAGGFRGSRPPPHLTRHPPFPARCCSSSSSCASSFSPPSLFRPQTRCRCAVPWAPASPPAAAARRGRKGRRRSSAPPPPYDPAGCAERRTSPHPPPCSPSTPPPSPATPAPQTLTAAYRGRDSPPAPSSPAVGLMAAGCAFGRARQPLCLLWQRPRRPPRRSVG